MTWRATSEPQLLNAESAEERRAEGAAEFRVALEIGVPRQAVAMADVDHTD